MIDGRDTGAARILLVDDREENLLALEAILAGLGHELLRATSGQQALKHLLIEDVSLILLDVQMPEMDGYETAAHIKGRPRTQDIPIIFLTAIDREAHQAYRGYAAGAVDFLAKPFDPWVLRAKVEVFVRLQQERRRLTERSEDLARRLREIGGDRLDGSLARIERLLLLAHPVPGPTAPGTTADPGTTTTTGADPGADTVPGPVLEALAAVRELRDRLTPPPP